jgi:hypothetical protein
MHEFGIQEDFLAAEAGTLDNSTSGQKLEQK